MEELKLGEVFEFENKKLIVKEDKSFYGCEGCIGDISYYDYICNEYKCIKEDRSDNKSVIFAEIKED